jgi:hypothetical protein
MRRTISVLALSLGAALPASAQTSNRGAFAVDAMFAPTAGLGLGYYVTDGLSLRPWLGLGYSSHQGFFANVGGQLCYELGSGWTVSPFLSVSAQYSHSDAAALAQPARGGTSGSPRPVTQGSGAQLGAGAGLRLRVSSDISLFGEGRLVHTTYPIGELRRGWTTFGVGERSYGQIVLGVSYLFR